MYIYIYTYIYIYVYIHIHKRKHASISVATPLTAPCIKKLFPKLQSLPSLSNMATGLCV